MMSATAGSVAHGAAAGATTIDPEDRDRQAYFAARERAGLPAKIESADVWRQVAVSLSSPTQRRSKRAA